jgi:hypothetical protein
LLRWGIHDCLDEAYVPFFGAFGAARSDAMTARLRGNRLGIFWPEMAAALIASSGGGGLPPTRAGRWSLSPGVST